MNVVCGKGGDMFLESNAELLSLVGVDEREKDSEDLAFLFFFSLFSCLLSSFSCLLFSFYTKGNSARARK